MCYKFACLIVGLLFFEISLFAQAEQKGWATELNSNKKPIGGVQVIFIGANPTDTDGKGFFTLNFKDKKAGEAITYKTVYRKGYEIVNEKDLFSAAITETDLKIFLCKEGYLDQARAEYYKISVAALTDKTNKKVKKLEFQLSEAKINEEQYLVEKRRLEREKEEAIKRVNELADKFARTNFDEVGNIYKLAFEQFQLGEINKAIEILNKSDLVAEAQKIIAEDAKVEALSIELKKRKEENQYRRDTVMQTIRLKIDLLNLNYEYEQVDTLYQNLLSLDSTDADILVDAGYFYISSNQYLKAIPLYKKVIETKGISEELYLEALSLLGSAYDYEAEFDKSVEAYKEIDSILLSQDPDAIDSLKFLYRQSRNYQDLGNVFRQSGNFVEAKSFYMKAVAVTEELFLKKNCDRCLRLAHLEAFQILGSISIELGDHYDGRNYYRRCYEISKSLIDDSTSNFRDVLATCCLVLGSIERDDNNDDSAYSYLIENKLLREQLFALQPKNLGEKTNLIEALLELGKLLHQNDDSAASSNFFFGEADRLIDEIYSDTTQRKFFGHIFADLCIKTGLFLCDDGDPDFGLKYLKKANDLLPFVTQEIGKTVEFKTSQLKHLQSFMSYYIEKKDSVGTMLYYSKAVAFGEELLKSTDTILSITSALVDLNLNLGHFFYNKGFRSYDDADNYYREALIYFHKARVLLEDQYLRSTDNDYFKSHYLASTYLSIGLIEFSLNSTQDYINKAVAINEKIFKITNGHNLGDYFMLKNYYNQIAQAIEAKGFYQDAAKYFKLALDICIEEDSVLYSGERRFYWCMEYLDNYERNIEIVNDIIDRDSWNSFNNRLDSLYKLLYSHDTLFFGGKDKKYNLELATLYDSIAEIEFIQGSLDNAAKHYKDASFFYNQLVLADPDNYSIRYATILILMSDIAVLQSKNLVDAYENVSLALMAIKNLNSETDKLADSVSNWELKRKVLSEKMGNDDKTELELLHEVQECRRKKSERLQFKWEELVLSLCNLGDFQMKTHRFEKAATSYRDALHEYPNFAHDDLVEDYADEKKEADIAIKLAIAYDSSGYKKSAVGEYQKVINLYWILANENPEVYNPVLAELLKKCAILEAEKNLDNAKKHFQQAIKIYGVLQKNDNKYFMEMSDCCNRLGKLYLKDNQSIELVKDSTLLATGCLNPDSLFQWINKEYLSELADASDSTRNEFIRSLRYLTDSKPQVFQPLFADFLSNLSWRIYWNFPKKLPEATDFIDESIQIWYSFNRDDTIFKKNLSKALHIKGRFLLSDNQFVEAEKYSRNAMALDSNIGFRNLAHALLFQGRFDEATAIYLKYKDKPHPDNKSYTFKNYFLWDFDKLEHVGITHPDVIKIRELLKNQ